MIRRAVSLALLCSAVAAPGAHAADPIMPLSEVRPGMACTGLSVVRGTEIASFGVEVLDVIGDDPTSGGPRILVRVAGPAVDASGVGPGFSGSPVLCGGRNAGAISEGIGDYGNKVVLATPIESILSARPAPNPAHARRAPGLLRAARPLAGPLTVGGLSPGTRRLLPRAAQRSGETVLAAPPGPVGGYPAQELVPGAAVTTALATGDISVGAVGTVTYRDGDEVYAFGHPLEGLGRRSLFLQDAYVFGVIGNPLGVPEVGAMTYKLTSAGGHTRGALTTDAFSAVSGLLGAGPRAIPLRVSARERGGKSVALGSSVADERELGLGAGLSFVAPLAVATAVDRLLGAFEPVTLKLCARFRVRQRSRPIGFCNTYFDGFTGLTDVGDAASLVEGFDLAPLTIEGAGVGIAVKRGVVDEVVVGARAARSVRPGQRLRVRVQLRRRRGGPRKVTVSVPVPRDLRPGRRVLVIEGNGFALDEEEILIEVIEDLARGTRQAFGRGAAAGAAASEPRTVKQLAARVADLHQELGITARFRGREPRVVLPSDQIRYDGRAKLNVRVLRRAKPAARR